MVEHTFGWTLFYNIHFYFRSSDKEFLPPEPLVEFLNEVQRDPRLNEILFPFYDRPRVLQLFAKYERNEENVKKGLTRDILMCNQPA